MTDPREVFTEFYDSDEAQSYYEEHDAKRDRETSDELQPVGGGAEVFTDPVLLDICYTEIAISTPACGDKIIKPTSVYMSHCI